MTAIEEPKVCQVVLKEPPSKHSKWDRELEAFYDLLPELLQTHRNLFVAVHDGRVIATGEDKMTVAAEAYRLAGNVELLIRLVTVKPAPPVRILSPRLAKNTNFIVQSLDS